jgi:coenzyme PQQ precursor peptide PqqA
MPRRLGGGGGRCDDSPRNREIPAATVRRSELQEQEALMQWTTPTAVDFRLGFEITMYVSAR